MTTGAISSLATGVCRGWVWLYTRRLDPVAAERRHAEIASDLHEHTAEAARADVTGHRLGAEILGRVLVGVPADLSWRRATRQPQPRLIPGGTPMSMSASTTNRALTVLGALTIVYVWFLFIGGFFLWTDNEDEISAASKVLWGAIPAISTIAMAAGLRLRTNSPRRGYWLIVAGAIGPIVWFWMVFIYAPLMIATIAIATNATPRKSAQLAHA